MRFVVIALGLALLLALPARAVLAQVEPDAVPQQPPEEADPAFPRIPGMPSAGDTDISRAELLDALLDRLHNSSDRDQASIIENAVLRLWLRSGSDTVDLLMGRALTAMKDENLARSLDLLNAVVDLDPDYAEGWNKRATVFFHMGDYGRSLNDVERTLALEPRHFGALAGLGLIMRELGDKERALDAFRRALEVHPFLPAAVEAEKELKNEVEGRGI